jgi:hypothetical protein
MELKCKLQEKEKARSFPNIGAGPEDKDLLEGPKKVPSEAKSPLLCAPSPETNKPSRRALVKGGFRAWQ